MSKTSELDPANIRFLRILVTTLTITMIAGIIIVIALLAIKLQPSKIEIPQNTSLPEDSNAISYSQGSDWIAVTTSENQILIFDSQTGKLRHTISVDQKN